jgi:hypothetical protein
MAKGQKRSNKEIRKPKQDKQPKGVVSAGSAAPLKIVNASGYSGKKK